jgi:hypothetical protein
MASQTDDLNDSGTLPRAELNPLLNPVLGENLGRWAEVYFTSAPETREMAVLELLRELETQEGAQEPAALPADNEVSHPADLPPQNPFGSAQTTVSILPADEEIAPQDSFSRNVSSLLPTEPEAFPSEAFSSDDEPYPGFTAEPSRSLRYAAIAVALVVAFALAYALGRGTRATPAASAPPQAAAARTAQSASPAPQSNADVHNAQQALVPDHPQLGGPTSPEVEAEPVNVPAEPPVRADSRPRKAAAPAIANAGAMTPLSASSSGGWQELAIAKKYLDGGASQARNTPEAVTWLWKSVAKQNAEATDLLSILYLRGDGVPKNCDQARLLLDAAARKGMKGAAERLSHLSSFGCQ